MLTLSFVIVLGSEGMLWDLVHLKSPRDVGILRLVQGRARDVLGVRPFVGLGIGIT